MEVYRKVVKPVCLHDVYFVLQSSLVLNMGPDQAVEVWKCRYQKRFGVRRTWVLRELRHRDYSALAISLRGELLAVNGSRSSHERQDRSNTRLLECSEFICFMHS